jgi:integrase
MPGHIRDLRKRSVGYGGSRPFQARWHHPADPRVKRERSFATKREAREWMAAQDTDATRGVWTDPNLGRESVAAIAAEWQQSRHRTGPKTRQGHDSILRAHVLPEFGERRISAIDAADIQKWVNRLAEVAAPTTVSNVFTVLRMVMDFGVRRRYIPANPCASVEKPPRRRRITIRPLTHEEVRALAGAMPSESARVAVLMAAYMGMRAGELWALKRTDVNLLRHELSIDKALKELTVRSTERLPDGYTRITPSLVLGPTKTHQTRKLNVPSFLADELGPLLADADAEFLFTDSEGGPVRHGNFYRRTFTKHMPAELSGTRWHDLRHTCASLLIAEGAHPSSIQRHLGHNDIQTTLNVYGHMFPAAQEAMAASMDAAFRAAAEPSAKVTRLSLP